VAGLRRVGPEAGGLSVAGPADDRQAGREPQLLGGRGRDLANHLSGREERRHLLAAKSDAREEVIRPVAPLHVDQAKRIGAGRGGSPDPGEAVHEECVDVDHVARALECHRLVLPQPQELVEGGRSVGRLAGQAVDLLGAQCRDLLGGPDIHPHDRRPDRPALLVDADERLALVGEADRLDVRAVDRLERLPDRRRA
jgi:hypothetical protein